MINGNQTQAWLRIVNLTRYDVWQMGLRLVVGCPEFNWNLDSCFNMKNPVNDFVCVGVRDHIVEACGDCNIGVENTGQQLLPPIM